MASHRPAGAFLLVALAAGPLAADDASPDAPTPVERADDLAGRATLSLYALPDRVQLDLNLRERLGDFTGWLGVFVDPKGTSIGRAGMEYDYQVRGLLAVPAFQVGTNGFVNGSGYVEAGGTVYAILGFTFTNLKPVENLSFDPNDAVVIGAGVHVSRYDKLYAFSVVDVRLGTGQQNTHVLYRRRLGTTTGLTGDLLFKSGHRDDGLYVRGVGIGLFFDEPRWFLKAYYDPWVNFTSQTMVRVGGGVKF